MSTNRCLASLTALILVACGGSPEDGDTTEEVPWVVGGLTFDGALVVDRSAVPVQSVTLGADGFVVIWEATETGGFFAPPLGALYLEAGTHTDVVVPLDQAIFGDVIHISVHSDDPADGEFTGTNMLTSSSKDPVMQTREGVVIAAAVALPNLPAVEPNRIESDATQVVLVDRKLPLVVTVERSPKYVVVYDADGVQLGKNGTLDKGPRIVNVTLSDIAASADWQTVTAKLFEGSGGQVDFDAPVLALDGVTQVALTLQVKWCGGNETQACNPEDPTRIYWADACGELGSVASPCGSGFVCAVDGEGAACVDADPCEGNTTTYCDPNDLTRVYWKDKCGEPNGNTIPCGAASACAGEEGSATCETVATCEGNTTKYCEPTDLTRVYWKDKCGEPNGNFIACGAASACAGAEGAATCETVATCEGNARTYCDLTDLSRVYWKDFCGEPNGSSIACGAASACAGPEGLAKCVTVASCEGNSATFCDPDDLTRVYWNDHCGQPNGNSFPCGAASGCVESDGEARCVVGASCAGNASLTCDPADLSQLVWLDKCGQPNGNTLACGATSQCVVTSQSATCQLAPTCAGNTTLVCDPSDLSKLFWLDRCGERSGSSIPCGGQCDDSSGEALCAPAPSCAGLTTKVCDASDPHKIFWLDQCGALAGSFIPCGDWVCEDGDGTPRCVNPDPCEGNATLACDPADLTRRVWLDHCGLPNGNTLACTGGTECSEDTGEAKCVMPVDPCDGPLTKVCLADDPSAVFYVDQCGVPTGASFPCGGTSTCTAAGGSAACTLTQTCADEHLLVCDPADPLRVLRTNGCGDDLGLWKTCANGKSCVEATAGQAECACTPTDEVRCQGTQNLYTDNPIVRIDSCGHFTGEVVATCGYGERCWYDDRETQSGAHCRSSVNDETSPYWHKGCTFVEYMDNPTDLLMDCRCRLDLAADPYIDNGPIDRCWPIGDAWNIGLRQGAGPHLHHLTFGTFYGGIIDKARKEVIVPFQYTDPTHQNAGMVVAFDYETGDRRIVSGDYPDPQGGITSHGSGYGYDVFVSGANHAHQHRYITRVIQDDDATGTLYTFGSNGLDNVEIVRVHPDTGLRTLVWARERAGTTPSTFGQCYSELTNAAFAGGFQPLQLERRAFAKDAADNFYLAYIGGSSGKASGDGLVKISANGQTCTIISAWNPGPDTVRSGPVGSGFAPQHGTIQGMLVKDGGIYAHHWIESAIVRHDLATGARTVVSNVDGSVGTGHAALGQSNFWWDATRSLLMTSGSPAPLTIVAVDLASGDRQFVTRGSRTSPLVQTVYDVERYQHGVMANGNVTMFGTVVMHPDDNDILFMTMEGGGLAKYEISTGNSFILSL